LEGKMELNRREWRNEERGSGKLEREKEFDYLERRMEG